MEAHPIETEKEKEMENGQELTKLAQLTKLTLEESFGALEEIAARLESEDITLEESFQVYQKGMEILKHCNNKIDMVEKKVLRINEDGQTDEF